MKLWRMEKRIISEPTPVDRDLGNIRGVIDEAGTVEQITNYYPFGAPYSDVTTTNPTFQRYKYNGKELELMHGLKWYDYGARWYDPLLVNWNRPDPSHKDYYPWSPYAYCGDNPVNAVDPDGRDWYITNQGNYRWQPNVLSQSDLQNGYKYIGPSIKIGNVDYRDDGTILYPDESSAYKRMRYQERITKTNNNPRGKEQMAFILEDSRVLVMPDNWNDSNTSTYMPTGINRNSHVLTDKHGNTFPYVAQVHTHPLGSDKGLSLQDELFAKADPDISIFIMHGDGLIYGGYYSSKRKGIDRWIHNDPIPIDDLIHKKRTLKVIADYYKKL